MDLKRFKEVINNPDLPDDNKEWAIIQILAKDPKVLPAILELLKTERENQRELLQDMNVQLSKADVFIDQIDFLNVKKEGQSRFNKAFVKDEIEKFYAKYKHVIVHCFKRLEKQ